jgi:hypothetical protein
MDRQLLDINELTFRFELADRVVNVVVDFDFSDFTKFDVERVGVLLDGQVDGGAETAAAFFFVKAARQVPELTDDDFGPFATAFVPVLQGDETAIELVGVD